MLRGAKLATALAKVKLIAVHGPWSRIIGLRHVLKAPGGKKGAPQPLWGGAAAIHGARFTPKGGFHSVYLAWEPLTALLEVQALVVMPGGTVSLRTAPWAVVTVDGIVSNVLNLADASILKALGTNEQEMTGAWAKGVNPPTQELAVAAYASARVEGIRYGSAKNPGGVNLVVFPDRLVAPSMDYLEVFDPHGNLTQRIGA
jgi:RES domain-containing protein